MRIWDQGAELKKTAKTVSIFAFCLLISALHVDAFTPPAGSPLAAGQHPRLLLTTANLPTIQAKMAGDFRTEYQQFINGLDSRISGPYNPIDIEDYAFACKLGTISGITYSNPISSYCSRAKTLLDSAPATIVYGD